MPAWPVLFASFFKRPTSVEDSRVHHSNLTCASLFVVLPCGWLVRFAEYRKDDPASFLLHQNLAFFPQFMFNMRRSPFVQVSWQARVPTEWL